MLRQARPDRAARRRRAFASVPPAPRVACALTVAVVASLVGCSQNPYIVGPGGVPYTGQPVAVSAEQAQISELSRRVQLLDDNNRQLTTQLAQSEQRSQVYRDELDLVRKQLADTTQQFEAAKIAASNAESRARSFQASTQLRGGASIQPNTNLSAQAQRLNLGGIPVEPDGAVIRITLPTDQLFQPGTAQLLPQSVSILDPLAAQLRGVFPAQRIGIEAYTDNQPVYGGQAATSQQLTAGQASAIYDVMTRRAGLPAEQFFTVAHGASHPRQDNTTAAGRATNRRVEIVIYPESF